MRSETYSTPGPLRLNLEIPAGEIEIETGNTNETRVELEAVANNDAIRDLVENSRIELVRRGDGHEVIVEAKSRQGIFISINRGPDIRLGGPDVRLRITCPHGADLEARTKSADVRARGEYGAVDLKTASGDLQVDKAKGPTRIKSASGDVHIDEVVSSLEVQSVSGDLHAGAVHGDIRAHLVSGDVHVRDAGGSISTNTVSGDQRFEAVRRGRMELKAISGDVMVGVIRIQTSVPRLSRQHHPQSQRLENHRGQAQQGEQPCHRLRHVEPARTRGLTSRFPRCRRMRRLRARAPPRCRAVLRDRGRSGRKGAHFSRRIRAGRIAVRRVQDAR
jgi:hypothetical protein